MKSYQNQVIWITGASSGIGEALAHEFSTTGAHLILSARKQAPLEKAAADCRQLNPGIELLTMPMDVSETANLPDIIAKALAWKGRVDMLVNCAGLSQRSLALETKPDVVRRIMEVNFFGTVFLTQAILPSMLERKSGRIVTLSSLLGKFHLPKRSAYAASKHALHGYFDTLRLELQGKGVGVTLITPGFVATHIAQNAMNADGTVHNMPGIPAEKQMSPAECANRIMTVLDKNLDEWAVGGIETWCIWLKRVSPKIFNWLVNRPRFYQ